MTDVQKQTHSTIAPSSTTLNHDSNADDANHCSKNDVMLHSPFDTWNVFSLISFWWMNDLIRQGFKKKITANTLPCIPNIGQSEKQLKLWEKDFVMSWLDSNQILSNDFEKNIDQIGDDSERNVHDQEHDKNVMADDCNDRTCKTSTASTKISQKSFNASGWTTGKLFLAIVKFMGWRYWIPIVFTIVLFGASLLTMSLVVLNRFVSWLGDTNQPRWHGWLYCLGFFFVLNFKALFINHAFFTGVKTELRVRATLLSLIYRKSLHMYGGDINTGHVTNLQSNDVQRIVEFCRFGVFVWFTPLLIIVSLAFVIGKVGWLPALVGFAIALLIIPTQALLGRVISAARTRMILWTDKRVSLMTEILNHIKLIKFYSWENVFDRQIQHLRSKELFGLFVMSMVKSINFGFGLWSGPVMTFATFCIYGALSDAQTGLQNQLNSSLVFTVLGIFNTISFPITIFPMAVKSMAETWVACSRLAKFFNQPQLVQTHIQPCGFIRSTSHPAYKTAIYVDNVTWISAHVDIPKALNNHVSHQSLLKRETKITHPNDNVDENDIKNNITPTHDLDASVINVARNDPTLYRALKKHVKSLGVDILLNDISLKINVGQHVGIHGPTGSGKSQLIQGILGELYKVSGDIVVQGTIAYVSQQTWLVNQSVKQNILFGHTYDHKRYKNILKICQLYQDMKQWPAFDDTEIGDRGLNLSGGQKQRISLARALYADRDIYLLDDPLSAVDSQVSKSIFDQVIRGLLRDKTVLIVSHHHVHLEACDQIIYMRKQRIYKQWTRPVGKNYRQHVFGRQSRSGSVVQEQSSTPSLSNVPHTLHSSHRKRKKNLKNRRARIKTRTISFEKHTMATPDTSPDNGTIVRSSTQKCEQEQDDKFLIKSDDPVCKKVSRENHATNARPLNTLTTEEQMVRGQLSWHVVKTYLKSAGILHVLLVLLIYVASQGALIMSDWYLSYWTRQSELGNAVNVGNQFYMSNWSALLMSAILLANVRYLIYGWVCLRAAKYIHKRLFKSVFYTQMLWFDQTPVGRIVNRFTKDQDTVDDHLADTMRQALNACFQIIGVIILMCIAFPWFTISIVPLAVAFWAIGYYYRPSSRLLKRIDGNTRSPIFQHLTTTLNGLMILRAFNHTNVFERMNFKKINLNNASKFYFESSGHWLAIRLEFLSALMVTIATLIAAGLREQITPTFASLAVTYSLTITSMFQWGLRQYAETEAHMTSVERLDMYSHLTSEFEIHDKKNNDSKLPITSDRGLKRQEGVCYKNVHVRYSENLSYALQNIDFRLRSGKRLGVIGRTGSGKSTLALALFGIVPIEMGDIIIDNHSIHTLDLKKWRNQMVMVPQDPVLFNGTIRFNLDPFDEYTDNQIWDALYQTHLKMTVQGLSGQLSYMVAEDGENFSMGQRQLFCMARALLKQPKILVLDEASANIDLETDMMIQTSLRENFKSTTIITIAHRLNTIMDANKIIVLCDGQISDIGKPKNMIRDTNSHLYKMILEMPKEEQVALIALAERSWDFSKYVDYYQKVLNNRKNAQ